MRRGGTGSVGTNLCACREADLLEAWRRTPSELREAITQAADNIRRYCEWQKPQEWRREIHPGVCVGQLVRPLESVGCYVPGGRYPLPSTLLMTVIPAQVAGVPQIRVVSPRPAQATLAAAAFLGVREFYRVGGAQAIAALAYGTESIPRCQQDRRSGQPVCDRGQEDGCVRLCH